MKKLILAAAIASASLPANAGSSAQPQMNVAVITQSASGIPSDHIPPALFITFLILLLWTGGSSVTPT